MNRLYSTVIALSAVTVVTNPAAATNITTNHFIEPTAWAVGDPFTTKAHWGSTFAASPNITNDLVFASTPSLPNPTIAPVAPGFVASSGGYYAFSGNYKVDIGVSNHAAQPGLTDTRVLIQAAATENPDFASIILGVAFTTPEGAPLAANLISTSTIFAADDLPSSFGPVDYSELSFEYVLPGTTGNFDIKLDVPVHASFAGVRVDTVLVPEPSGALLVAGLGAGALLRRRGRRSAR